MNSQVWWYVARASGIVAWSLLALSMVWGLALSTRVSGRRPTAAWLADLHRALGGLAIAFTGVHLVGLIADSYVEFGWVDVLVPFASSWEPGAVAAGVVALYLLVAVEATSLLRRRVGPRAWRWLHAASFPLYALATGHLLFAGTDAGHPAQGIAVLVSLLAIGTLTLVRILLPRRRGRKGSPATPQAARAQL